MVDNVFSGDFSAEDARDTDFTQLLAQMDVPVADRAELDLELKRAWATHGTRIKAAACALRRQVGDLFGRRTTMTTLPCQSTPGALNVPAIAALLETWPALDDWWRQRGCGPWGRQLIASELGRQMRVCRAVIGRVGIIEPDWLELIWRGGFSQVGRLQYEVTRPPNWLPLAAEDDYVLAVHIPRGGPLTADSVEESLGKVRDFFAAAFPWLRVPRYAICDSWLLSAQLPMLAPHTNVSDFQGRWLVAQTYVADGEALFFLFDQPRDLLTKTGGRAVNIAQVAATLTPTSSLQEALCEHWQAGRHLWAGRGWLPLP